MKMNVVRREKRTKLVKPVNTDTRKEGLDFSCITTIIAFDVAQQDGIFGIIF
jgi:hypothetical protein